MMIFPPLLKDIRNKITIKEGNRMICESYIARMRNDFLKEYKNKEYFNAARLGERILGVYKDNNSPDSLRYAQDMYNLARAYEKEMNFEKALAVYDDAKNMVEYITQDTQTLPKCLGDIYTNMAVLYKKMDKGDLAMSCFEKAYNIYKDTLSDLHPEFAKANYNMGSVYFDIRNYQEALYYYQECLNRIKAKSPLYYDTLNSIGYCYEMQGDYTQAQRVLENALQVIIDIHGINSEEYLVNINYISNLLLRAKKYKEALVQFKKTTAVTKAIFGEKHPMYAELLSKLGDVYGALKDYDMAIMFKTKALNIASRNGNNLNHLTILLNLVSLYKKSKQFDKAATVLKKVLDTKRDIIGIESVTYIKESINLADLYTELTRIDEAVNILEGLLDNPKLTPVLCKSITARLVRFYEENGIGKKLYDLYNIYVKFFPNRSFDDMLAIAENDE